MRCRLLISNCSITRLTVLRPGQIDCNHHQSKSLGRVRCAARHCTTSLCKIQVRCSVVCESLNNRHSQADTVQTTDHTQTPGGGVYSSRRFLYHMDCEQSGNALQGL